MTIEEAIKELRDASDNEVRYGDTDNHYNEVMKRIEALDMAIEALEQQSCEDCTVIKKLSRKYYVEDEYGYTDENIVNKVNEIIDVVNKLSSVTPKAEQKWIPCAERLPETNDIYLVSMHSYGLPTRDIDGYIQQTDKKWEVYGNKVIAWMPLPQPYKAESEE